MPWIHLDDGTPVHVTMADRNAQLTEKDIEAFREIAERCRTVPSIMTLPSAIETLRETADIMDGQGWFRIRKGSDLVSIDGTFTRRQLRALMVLSDQDQNYDSMAAPFT